MKLNKIELKETGFRWRITVYKYTVFVEVLYCI